MGAEGAGVAGAAAFEIPESRAVLPVEDFTRLAGHLGAENELVLFPITPECADLALELVGDEQNLVLEAGAPAGIEEMVADVRRCGHGWTGEIARRLG